jgi:hypothetical protein
MVEEKSRGIGILLTEGLVASLLPVLHDRVELIRHRIMAHGPEICQRQICQTLKTQVLLVKKKLLSACDALSGKQYVCRRFQSPQNTPFHMSAIYNCPQSNAKSFTFPII